MKPATWRSSKYCKIQTEAVFGLADTECYVAVTSSCPADLRREIAGAVRRWRSARRRCPQCLQMASARTVDGDSTTGHCGNPDCPVLTFAIRY